MSKHKKLWLTNLITFSNIKLGGNIAQLNMPYAKTCRNDAPCFKDCYCTHGNMAYPSVRNSHLKKYEAYTADPIGFFDELDRELNQMPIKYFRWHSAGDIVDIKYLNLMCWLARRHKDIRFLCFTKKFEMVNTYLDGHRKPDNLILVLSNWGNWRVINPHNLPESFVNFGRGDEAIPRFAYECSGSCGSCDGQHCWHMKKGDSVVFHKH